MDRFSDDGSLVLDRTYTDLAGALSAAHDYLIGLGHDAWDVDRALAAATFDRAYWSDTYRGFVHDCAGHSPAERDPDQCHDDTVTVTVVTPIPPPMQRSTS